MTAYQNTCAVCGAAITSDRPRKTCGQRCRYRLVASTNKTSRLLAKGVLRVENGVAFIPLTRGKFAMVDEADAPLVSKMNWRIFQDRAKHQYAAHGQRGMSATLFMHRYVVGAKKGEWVDHINGNGLDNRRSNLRKATPTENARNRIKQKNGSSKYKGVSRSLEKWSAKIQLGRFATEEEAARAYDEAARRLHGEFACVNFPIGDERSALH